MMRKSNLTLILNYERHASQDEHRADNTQGCENKGQNSINMQSVSVEIRASILI